MKNCIRAIISILVYGYIMIGFVLVFRDGITDLYNTLRNFLKGISAKLKLYMLGK